MLFFPETGDPHINEIGGKAFNLHRLQAHQNVPNWFALPADIFTRWLAENGLNEAIQLKIATLSQSTAAGIAADIRELILGAPLPEDLCAALGAAIKRDFGESYLSVRSSSADEDGMQHSFAGIHESYLYIRGADSAADHIRRVWASGYQERALLYRQENGLPLHPVPMAVIVQRMVDATTSGVVFTADPTTQNPHSMVISSLYGLGEGLVSAGLDADHVGYSKRSGEFTTRLANKPTRYALDATEGSGICETPVDAEKQDVAALSEGQLRQLVAASLEIESSYRAPQDIEFCFDAAGKLYILQTRAITTMEELGPAAGNAQVWDNSNIIESYSGVTSPMTFSFIRNAYAVVYNCFSEVMGIPRKTITNNQSVYRNMLGLFNGQVYYNLPNWYRLVQQFPGYAYNKDFMESMMGVKEKSNEPEQPQASRWQRYGVELPKLLSLLVRMGYRFMTLHRLVPSFNRHFDRYYSQWEALDFETLPPHELMKIYDAMEHHLLRNWKIPIINDFYVMVYYGVLKGCCQKWCHDPNGTLQNNLICGEGDIESTVPTRILMKLAASIKQSPACRTLFLEKSPEELLVLIPQRDDTRHIARAIDDYLKAYGFRCMNELKLEEPSLHETPEFVYQMVANYVRMDDALLDLPSMEAREQAIRTQAEEEAFAPLAAWQSVIFRHILKHARRGVKNRENMRFARTKIYGLLRLLLNAIGNTFSREAILDTPADIYYLAIDEVWDFIKGTAITTDLRGLVALRKAEFERYRNTDAPADDHFETYGMAYHRNRFVSHEAETEAPPEDGVLRGIGCSPGSVAGVARVIKSPRDNISLNGEILVASRTDPGWVPLYPSVSGILIERGSILSHSAIVAREMGIPAIVGIPHLLETISDGQALSMDASKGEVILEQTADSDTEAP